MVANALADSNRPVISGKSPGCPVFTLHTRSRAIDRVPAGRRGRPAPERWAIVLAGGEGTRMRPLISHWLGGDRPKQYCTFVGSRSMFQHTLDRACSVVPEEHIVTVIGRGHRKFLAESADENLPGVVLEQPGNFGTAPGVFLPLTYVLADNPEATILLLPSDHFVYPEDRFCDHAIHALELAERHLDQVILVGAVPDRAETDYGWIDPHAARPEGHGALTTQAAPPPARGAMKVVYFREKPDETEARALFRQGCLWNTMVLAVNAKTLWALGRQCLPEIMYKFEALLMVLRAVRAGRLDPQYETSALASVYADLAPADFSRNVLQHISHRSLVLPMEGVNWCDWGRPQRVAETLAGLGRRPLFPAHYIEKVLEPAALANGVLV